MKTGHGDAEKGRHGMSSGDSAVDPVKISVLRQKSPCLRVSLSPRLFCPRPRLQSFILPPSSFRFTSYTLTPTP